MLWKNRDYSQLKIFISIGAGYKQAPLIEEAKRMGYHIIGVDRNTNATGICKCDIKIQESTDNYEDIYTKINELLIDGEVEVVLSKSFGPAIKTACFISNKLNIPLIPYNRIDDFIDKKKMKSIFKKNKINSPDFSIYNKNNSIAKTKKTEFPVVIKPLKGHAKTNIELLQDNSDFERYFNKVIHNNNNNHYIIEKYIKGNEIIAAGIVHKNKFHLIDIIDKITTPPPFFVDLMHISPSKYLHLWDEVVEVGQQIADAFDISTSPLIIELLITEKDEIFVIEAVPEFGGEYIPEILIPERTGYNFLRETIKAVIGNGFSPPRQKKGKENIIVKYITGENGTLTSLNPVCPSRVNGVIFSQIFKDIGSKIRNPETNHDRIGVLIARGRTREDAIHTAQKAELSLDVKIK
ncbi:MAG: ATP-grasp domain-containing protein [Spirochaetota bacterium]|nr:ATP-grasp domain-containing protein [Spirochaetota bacterium]